MGSAITRLLSDNGYKLFVLKRTGSDTYRINDLIKEGRVNLIDIDNEDLFEVFKFQKFDIVIHAATSYGRNDQTHEEIAKVNIELPAKLLEFAIANKSKLFINTDTFFELTGDDNQRDLEYIKTKKGFLKLAENTAKNITKFANLRLEHVYGPDDNPTKFVPFLIRKLCHGNTVDFNPGEHKRDFIYLEDVANAFLQTIKNLKKLGPWEEFGIGTEEIHTIKDLGEEIRNHLTRSGAINWGAKPYSIGENMHSKGADTSNNQKIGWGCTYSFDKGVKKTVESYLKSYEKK